MFEIYTTEMYKEDKMRFGDDDIINTYVDRYVRNVENGMERMESDKGGTVEEEIIIVNYYRKVMREYDSLLRSFDTIPHENDIDWLLNEGLLNDEQHLHLDCYTRNKCSNGKMGLRRRMYDMDKKNIFFKYVENYENIDYGIKIYILNEISRSMFIPSIRDVVTSIGQGGEFLTLLSDLSDKDTVNNKLKLNKSNRLAIYAFIRAYSSK